MTSTTGDCLDLNNSDIDHQNGKKDEINHGTNEQENYLTLTGTIKRSKKSGQPDTDVEVTVKREELGVNMESSEGSEDPDGNCLCFRVTIGFMAFLWTIVCAPFVLVVASVYSFYMGTITWYNILSVFSGEDTNFFYRISVSPLLIIIYPLYIILCSLGLGFYSSLVQIGFSFDTWWNVVHDLEKGFYGWLCHRLGLEECSPYELVILTDIKPASNNPAWYLF